MIRELYIRIKCLIDEVEGAEELVKQITLIKRSIGEVEEVEKLVK